MHAQISYSVAGNQIKGPSPEAQLAPVIHSMGDFPLEQSCDDTLRSVFVIRTDGHMVHEAELAYPHSVSIKDRLYRVSHDSHRRGAQLVVGT